MPLPWTFARNALMPLRVADEIGIARSVFHVRVFSDPWAGDLVIVGELGDQPVGVDRALRDLWRRLRGTHTAEVFRLLSYRPGNDPPFRAHVAGDDLVGIPAISWPSEGSKRSATAAGVRLLQHGPNVDVWDTAHYRLSTFQLERVRAHARRT